MYMKYRCVGLPPVSPSHPHIWNVLTFLMVFSLFFSSSSVSSASENPPSSFRVKAFYWKDSPAPITPVFSKTSLHLRPHLASLLRCSLARPVTCSRLMSTRRTSSFRAAADQPTFTSPRPSSRACGLERRDDTRTTRRWVRWWPTPTWTATSPLRKSPCLWWGSRVFWGAASALLLQVQLALSFMCFCPARLRERRPTANLWMKASWMSWMAR